MEFVQFHPTGMIWPPSVRGILVTEGVRGEGGVLRNNRGERFMFSDIPELIATRPPRTPRKAGATAPGDRNANRPAELLTRDHVARCILREVQGGPRQPARRRLPRHRRGSRRKSPTRPSTSRSKLPSMYHQFKELGDIDITKEPMEVGPTTHYIMGGVRVDADTQMSDVPGLFACGECAAGINGANRLGGNSLSDLLVFGKRAGEYAAKYAKDHAVPAVHADQVEAAAKWALAPFEHAGSEGPYQVQHDLQDDDAGSRRHRPHVRTKCCRRWRTSTSCGDRAAQARVVGNREYNPGWHTALDLHNLLTVSEAITRCGLAQGKPRRPFPRRLSDQGASTSARSTWSSRKGAGGPDAGRRGADPGDAGGVEADHRGEQVTAPSPGRVFEPWGCSTPRARRLALGLGRSVREPP